MFVHPSADSALLVIDMQVGLYHGPERPFDAPRVLSNVTALITRARRDGIPIFAARHTGPVGSPIAAGSAAWQLLPELGLDRERDLVFDKTRPSCFFATDLADRLRAFGIGRLIVVGMKTQYCVDTTVRAASDLGFRVTLVADGHTCMDTPALRAEAIVAHHNDTLRGAFAEVVSTEAVAIR